MISVDGEEMRSEAWLSGTFGCLALSPSQQALRKGRTGKVALLDRAPQTQRPPARKLLCSVSIPFSQQTQTSVFS